CVGPPHLRESACYPTEIIPKGGGNGNRAASADSVKPTGVVSTSRPSPVRPSSPVPRDGSLCGAAVKGRLRPSPLDGAPPHRLLGAQSGEDAPLLPPADWSQPACGVVSARRTFTHGRLACGPAKAGTFFCSHSPVQFSRAAFATRCHVLVGTRA